MLCDEKYYIAIGNDRMIQVPKKEHERIRKNFNEPLIEVSKSDYKNFIWIDDPKCDSEL